MQNIKNFQRVVPTAEQLKKLPAGEAFQFLLSEDGQDWYECQQNFADDTIKIMYDADGVIRAIVDKPVPQRGNILAVSMLYPLGMSVAELENVPAGCTNDGSWCFSDGAVIRNTAWLIRQAEQKRQRLLTMANKEMVPLQCAMLLNDVTDDEIQRLKTLLAYSRELGTRDLVSFPETPLPDFP